MQIITLTSDWGLTDHYAASVKGKIMAAVPGAGVVDISHTVKPFNLRQASYIIKNSYTDFPEGTIHILAVNTVHDGSQKNAVIFYRGHYFIGTDNGLLSLIFDKTPEIMRELDPPETKGTFSSVEQMIETARQIAGEKSLDKIGKPKDQLAKQLHFKPVVTDESIRGLVIYVDNYENVITNITEDLFRENMKERNFKIECRSEQITEISNNYPDVPAGDIVAFFNRSGHLEIAINKGNASGLLGLQVDDPVSINFS